MQYSVSSYVCTGTCDAVSTPFLLRCCLRSTSLLCQQKVRQTLRTFLYIPSYLRWSPWCYFSSCVFSSHACYALEEWEPSRDEPRSTSLGRETYKQMPLWCKKLFEVTVLFDWESPKPSLCIKFALFMTSWLMFKLLLQRSPLNSYLPYLRGFQWGTVWPCTSKGN